jgi:hypothetical protein
MQARTGIDAGVCGFHTDVNTSSEDGMFVTFEATSGCEKISALGDALAAKGPINAYEEISPQSESVIMATVPVGLFKSMQVAAGLALPKDITIHITKE